MEYRDEHHDESAPADLIDELESLRRFNGPPAQFWPLFLEKAGMLVTAHLAVLLMFSTDDKSWKRMALWPESEKDTLKMPKLTGDIERVAGRSLAERSAISSDDLPPELGDACLIGLRLGTGQDVQVVAVFIIGNSTYTDAEEARMRLSLIADTPSLYQLGRLFDQTRSDVGKFSDSLDLTVLINDQTRYVAAAMTLCNEVASRFNCDRVSLGWLKDGYVRVQAISHIERFEKKMDVVQALEAVMEEALDQDTEIVWPSPPEGHFITRSHESFSKREGASDIVSLPMRIEGVPVAVLTCERSGDSFAEETVRGLRLLSDLATRRLGDLRDRDRWIGARVAGAVRDGAGRLVGVEHTFAKLAGIVLMGLLAFGIFGTLEYRVEAPFVLKSDDVVYVSAPFDGFIDQVPIDVGDPVEPGDLLLSFDTRELLLQEATAIANQIRYEREAEQARAQRATADMMIAEALADQAGAQLALVRHFIERAEVRAPFNGIVVEGDLQELLGTPAQKGDALFRIARTENLYAELELDERDAQDVSEVSTGEIAFLTRPDLVFPIVVERTDPVTVTRDADNVFIVRANLSGEASDWWRPGMSGIAKINAGRRNVLWILTHRTIDFLRMYLWW